MKRGLYLAAVLLPLAALAGWKTAGPTAGEGGTRSEQQAASSPASSKVSTRGELGKRPPPPPQSWKDLKQRAACSAEVQAEVLALLNSRADLIYEGDKGWLLQHLLRSDPAGTLREIRDHCEEGQFGNVILFWCIWDPDTALATCLADKEIMSGGIAERVNFQGVGAMDAERGLKMILDLPPEQRRPDFFVSLLHGIANEHPEQAVAYFDRIVAEGKIPEAKLGELLASLSTADPDRALAWAEKHYGKVPDKVAAQVVQSLAGVNPQAAMKLYQGMSETSEHERQSAGFWITHTLAEQGLEVAWDWIEANAAPGSVEYLKGNSWSYWAWRNKDEAVERILRQPDLLKGQRASEMVNLLQSMGREKELLALIETLPAEQAGPLQKLLSESGLTAAESAEPRSSAEWLKRLAKDVPVGGDLLKSMPEASREELAASLGDSDFGGDEGDPRVLLEILGASRGGIDRKGGHKNLARLALLDSAEAARAVEAMPPGEARNNAVDSVWRNWKVDDSTSAAAWKEKMLGGK